METLNELLGQISSFVWGPPLIILLLATGVWLTFLLRGIQFTKLGHALYLGLIKRKEVDHPEGDISHFQALMTALSATVGTGNIAGVATAITLGGPGALFWMWVTGLVGMATKYTEALLAVKYRVTDKNGQMAGGPMYYIERGLKMKPLAVAFAFFASIAAFGIGNMVQSNSVASALHESFSIPVWVSGLVLMAATGLVVLGGIQSIARVTSVIVPVMIIFYAGAALVVLFIQFNLIGDAFALVFKYAFTPHAGAGGFAGAAVMTAVRFGMARGVFSNESGLGSSPIAAAAAKTSQPGTQALVSMTQTFIDTIVICTLTGLVIIISGEWMNSETGARLTSIAFERAFSYGSIIVTISLTFFAFSTILGWCYYGERSIEYLFGERAIFPYRLVFTGFVLLGALGALSLIWTIADILNALMALPNLIALLLLSPVAAKETKDYFAALKGSRST